MDQEAQVRLADWLSRAFGTKVELRLATRLSGGAIQENWLLEIETSGELRGIVIRKDAPATIAASHSRRDEFRLLELVYAAGILVPEPLAFCEDAAILGGPFAVMEKVGGTGFGPKIVKDTTLGGDREALVRDIGRQLGRIHRLDPADSDFAFLGEKPVNPLRHDIAGLRANLDALGIARPALEWGLSELADVDLPCPVVTFIHRDLRTGNYMVDSQGLTAILDWEFASWGDPMSDLGWFSARCWRFSRPEREAGGIGSRDAFYAGYAETSDIPIDRHAIRIWEIMAHLRWAVIALQQAARHTSGREPSLELALIGRIVPELELEVLRATPRNTALPLHALLAPAPVTLPGEPGGTNLLAAGLDLIAGDFTAEAKGEARYRLAMIASAMRMAAREAQLAPAFAEARGDLLRQAGAEDETALASGLRNGSVARNGAIYAPLLRLTRLAATIARPGALNAQDRAALALPAARLFD